MPTLVGSIWGAMTSNAVLTLLLAVLIVLAVLMFALSLVFIIALRKRAPVIKVIMAPSAKEELKKAQDKPEESEQDAETCESEPEQEETESDKDDGDDENVSFVTEGEERVRYDRSVSAKLMQMKSESKEWYTQLKNELLSYQNVKARMSWKRESFRIGRSTFARIIVRGRTLCLLLAVETSGFAGTKFAVENVGHVASTADTPCLYRIKSDRRNKYAKELIAAVMNELGVKKQAAYEAQDFYMPYAGDMALMQKGLIKRVVSGSTQTFEIRETTREAAAAADRPAQTSDNIE